MQTKIENIINSTTPNISQNDPNMAIKLLSEYGLSNLEILRGATSYNAQLFLNDQDFGIIEEGKRADLLLLSANTLIQLETIENPEKIIAGGRIIERNN